jgi:hypothetical protein
MADNKLVEAAWQLGKSATDLNRTFAESALAAQERGLRFVLLSFENGVEVFTGNAERTHTLVQELTGQPQQPQVAIKAVTDATVSIQERSARFAQSVVENGIELLTSQADANRELLQTVAEQARKQQEVIQTMTRESANAYIEFFNEPFSYYRQAANAVGAAVRQGMENFQDAAEKVQSSVNGVRS